MGAEDLTTGSGLVRQTIHQFLMQASGGREEQEKTCLVDGERAYSRADLIGGIQKLAVTIQQTDQSNWVLACNDSRQFLTGLLALVMAGKRVLLPPNDKPGTLKDISQCGQALLTDGEGQGFEGFVLRSGSVVLKDVYLNELSQEMNQSELVFFTSGSSGHAKPVTKSLHQLEAEILALESLWGRQLGTSVILSCVSHQHIYGVLFRLLWPLLTGRVIDTRQFEYPEQLLEAIKSYPEVAIVASPAQLGRLPMELGWKAIQQHISSIFSSGAPLAAGHAIQAHQCFGHYPVEVLGSTETGGVAWRQQNPHLESNEQAVDSWTPITGVIPTLSNGQLKVYSPWLEEPDTGFLMGDRASLLDGNQFLLHGRADLIVKIEGKRVSLTELSKCLKTSPLVETAEIVMLERGRQQLGAVVILTDAGNSYLQKYGKLALSRQLKNVLGEYFEAVTLPRKWRFPKCLPVNSQGKIVRKELASLFDNVEKQHA